MKKLFQVESFAFLGIFIFLLIVGRTHLFRDPGTFWHIVVGQRILSKGQLIHTDSFSFTFAGKPWIAHQWLGECIMALVHRAGGLDGLLLMTSATLALLYALITQRLLRSGVHFLLAILIVAFGIAASSYNFHARPQIATLFLIGFIFSRLCDFEAGRRSLNSIFWFIPLFLLWANIHGGVLGGIGTLSIAIGGWSFAKMIKTKSPVKHYREMIMLFGILVACFTTVFMTPYGFEMIRTWLYVGLSPVISNIIQEQSSLFKQKTWALLWFCIFYVVLLAGTFPKRPRTTWLIPLVWFGLACSRVRHGPLFVITALIALSEFLPEVRWFQWMSQRGYEIFQVKPERRGLQKFSFTPWVLPLTLVVITAFCQVAFENIPLIGRDWVRLDPRHWPVELLPELQKYEKTHLDGTPIFNDMLFGGFLIYFTPRLRVFIDDRCELYGDDALIAYTHPELTRFEEWAKTYRFDLALVITGQAYDNLLSGAKGWRLARRTPAASLYQKREAPCSYQVGPKSLSETK